MTPEEDKASPEPQEAEQAPSGDSDEAKNERSGEERRKHPRFAIQDCTVQHKKAGLLARLRSFSEEQAPVVNMSMGGLQFLTNERLRVDDRIYMRAHLPKGEEPLDLKGTIVWQGAGNEEHELRIGVLFSKASEKTWRRLQVLERAYTSK